MNPTPTDLAAERIHTAYQGVGGYDDDHWQHEADAVAIAREYLRLLPTITAVRARKAEWDGWEKLYVATSQVYSPEFDTPADRESAYVQAALALAAVCGEGEMVGV